VCGSVEVESEEFSYFLIDHYEWEVTTFSGLEKYRFVGAIKGFKASEKRV
jgi:hypothetical protein